MVWELEALKILAKNVSVPGVALRDAISEIERQREEFSKKENDLKFQIEKLAHLVKVEDGGELAQCYLVDWRAIREELAQLKQKIAEENHAYRVMAEANDQHLAELCDARAEIARLHEAQHFSGDDE